MRTPNPRTLLCYDPAEAAAHLRAADPQLAPLIDEVGPLSMRPDPSMGVFESLMRSIVYQQLSGKAAGTIFGRMCELFEPGPYPTPRQLLNTTPERLRTAGVSANKARALHDLAQRALDGTVPTIDEAMALDDDELVRRLTAVRGVGRWTVEMLLIFRLGRPDVLPCDDLGVRKGYQLVYRTEDLPTTRELLVAGEDWRPFRSVASWYLWRAVDTAVPA